MRRILVIATATAGLHLNVHKGTPGTSAFTNASNPVSISATHC